MIFLLCFLTQAALFYLIKKQLAIESFLPLIASVLCDAALTLSLTVWIGSSAKWFAIAQLLKGKNLSEFLLTILFICGIQLAWDFLLDKLNRTDLLFAERRPRLRFPKAVRIFYFLSILFVLLGNLLFFSSRWAISFFDGITIDQVFFQLSAPLEGTGHQQIYAFLESALAPSLFVTIFFAILLYLLVFFSIHILLPKKSLHISLKKIALWQFPTAILLFVGGLTLGIQEFGFADVKNYFFTTSTVFEEHYQDPAEITITFPKEKRNLIYIFVESLENTFSSTDNGGGKAENLIPGLTQLALGNQFSNTSDPAKLGGAFQVSGTNFTAGAMVSQTSGIPLKTALTDQNTYGETSAFLPGAYALGEILQKENYNQLLMLGSDASFGGRKSYFTQHGGYQIFDYNTAKENGDIPADYQEWWGFEDQKLYEYAQRELTTLSEGAQPFNFTLLTADTHFEDGYDYHGEMPQPYDDPYSNVYHYTDEMLTNFVSWIQEQPFYENTTVIISGDHLTMDSDFCDDVSEDYERTIYNAFLNPAIPLTNQRNRKFTTMDMYPTTLAALGAKLSSDRMGLGTNLFSSTPTLPEEIGSKIFYNQFALRSSYYDRNLTKTGL